ncbi:riboflavin synthase subunit alpha [Ammoniphilus oxalaticus]|uniref:Riboflavin synthase n=1 Tax=Ammoniphilus oxalaticus TaxID=66863 RepID=A0A419SKA5_9BACL|nr:riboflavin synthase [Ammoniphilus oxalaticus]RKD24380.1 riboflavin synthase subunit alpha [Ammoniphilus oxalaticus]
MFTGIVEEKGVLKAVHRGENWMVLTIEAATVLEDVGLGDSIAVNGVCLTVTSFTTTSFTVDVMPETFEKTNLSSISIGAPLNLERAMAADGRFGGHFVSGHVDGTGTVASIKPLGNAVVYEIKAEETLLYYMIPKGSITIDGISLTLLDVNNQSFTVSIIPHTLEQTTLQDRKVGDQVNLECDMIGKYIEKFIQHRKPTSNLTKDFLTEHGFI